MIPKIIHYCWFGKNPLPKLAQKCIESWKKYCPDYEIKEWNEENFSISSAPVYVQEAYQAKKWAFVSDYVRLWAMVNFGGIYMDTDVEVIRPLDKFLQFNAFSGFEDDKNIPTGIMACQKGFPLFEILLHEYDNISFLNDDGSYDFTTNVERITSLCAQYSFVPNNSRQNVEGFELFPKDYFCPLDFHTRKLKKTKNTVTIHWFSASWWDEQMRKYNKKQNSLFNRIRYYPNRMLKKILGDRKYEKLKCAIKKNSKE